MEKKIVFIKRYPSKGELPKRSGDYDTDNGLSYFSHSRKKFSLELTQDGGCTYSVYSTPKYWFEAIELPSEEDVNKLSDCYITDIAKNAYKRGANFILNFILNKLKGE